MSLIRIGSAVIDIDDVRCIVDKKCEADLEGAAVNTVVVTFRDGTSVTFDRSIADAIRRFVANLPDGIPTRSPRLAAQGELGRLNEFPVVEGEKLD